MRRYMTMGFIPQERDPTAYEKLRDRYEGDIGNEVSAVVRGSCHVRGVLKGIREESTGLSIVVTDREDGVDKTLSVGDLSAYGSRQIISTQLR